MTKKKQKKQQKNAYENFGLGVQWPLLETSRQVCWTWLELNSAGQWSSRTKGWEKGSPTLLLESYHPLDFSSPTLLHTAFSRATIGRLYTIPSKYGQATFRSLPSASIIKPKPGYFQQYRNPGQDVSGIREQSDFLANLCQKMKSLFAIHFDHLNSLQNFRKTLLGLINTF